jgi:ADP-ribose pyrophosphatase YjhB (NUDIX family)
MARDYPDAPVAAVGGVVIADGAVLLVCRAFPPRQGEWSLPGGRLELGESLTDGVAREVREETGLEVEVGAVVDVFDRVHRDEAGRIRYHFVIVDFLCRPRGGTLAAGDDAADARWVPRAEVAALGVNAYAVGVIERAFRLHAGPQDG